MYFSVSMANLLSEGSQDLAVGALDRDPSFPECAKAKHIPLLVLPRLGDSSQLNDQDE